MQDILFKKLHSYICEHNPELVINLNADFSLRRYLEEKVMGITDLIEAGLKEGQPDYIIQELCLEAMTRDLRPSIFLYLRNLIKEEFKGDYLMMRENGTLTQETINTLYFSKPLFEDYGFSEENESDPTLRLAVITAIDEYLRNADSYQAD